MVVTCFHPSPYKLWSFLGYMLSSYMSFPFFFGDEHLQMPAVSWCEQDRIGFPQSSCRSCIRFLIMYSYCKKNTGRVQKELNEISERKLSPSLVLMFWIVIFFICFPFSNREFSAQFMPRSVHQFQLSFFILTGKNEVFLCHAAHRSHGNHGIHAWNPLPAWQSSFRSRWTTSQLVPPVSKIPSYTASLKTSWDIHLYHHPINSNEFQSIPIQSSDSIDCLPTNISNICNVDCQNLCVYVPIVQTKQMQIVDPYRFMMVHGYT